MKAWVSVCEDDPLSCDYTCSTKSYRDRADQETGTAACSLRNGMKNMPYILHWGTTLNDMGYFKYSKIEKDLSVAIGWKS